MKTKFYSLISVIVITIFLNLNINAQEKSPEEVLKQSHELFDDGQVDNIPRLLIPLIEEGFKRKQKKEAYILLIKSYLFDDFQQEAKNSMKEMLKDFPEYKPSEDEAKELTYIYNLFKPVPFISFGPAGGINISTPVSEKTYLQNPQPDDKKVINVGMGNQFGAYINGRIYNYINFRIEAFLSQKNYSFEVPNNGNTTIYDETVSQISPSFWLIPHLPINDHLVYLKIGGGINSISSSTATVSSLTEREFDTKGKLNSMNSFVGAGAGFSFKIPTGYISVDGSYQLGLGNVINTDNRNEIPDLVNDYNYIDDDYKINSIVVSVSYVYIFYKKKK